MDPVSQNQTSFIPRKTLGRESSIREKPVSIFLVIATFVFIVALLGSSGVFLYKYILTQNIASSGKYLDQRKAALEPATINDLIRTDKRLRVANQLLGGHIVTTPVFILLEDLTLQTVRFTRFEYINVNSSGPPTVKVSGQARSYGSVALQADLLNGNKQFIKSAVFSNLNLDDKGNVTFDAMITLDPDLTNYKKALARTATAENQ